MLSYEGGEFGRARALRDFQRSLWPRKPGRDGLLLFFCHHGLACTAIGHLLDIAPPQLLDGFFLPPASVTVLHSEEREPGIAAFRCQCMGDTSHLRAAGLPVSRSGAFGEPFPG